ncbi:MAG TPA: PfkB family carbohydrate kinase, partial [Planctomycetota bacterium]|nr:PfkB family carbohydrate kinase [Planctomycetota bacterium]
KGEHGAILFHGDRVVPLPAFPTGRDVDPTGAGDSFAGGLMGFLTKAGSADGETLRRAIAWGTVAASFTVQDFGTEGIRGASAKECEARFEQYCEFLRI